MHQLPNDLISSQSVFTKEVLKNWNNLYGVPAIIHRVTKVEDEITEVYGKSSAKYSPKSQHIESFNVSLPLIQDSLTNLVNHSNVPIVIITEVPNKIQIGDQIEFKTPDGITNYYRVDEIPEQMYGIYFKCNLVSEVSIRSEDNVPFS